VSGLAARRIGPVPEAKRGEQADTDDMKVSYGIRWRAVDRERSGRLSVAETGLTFVDGNDLEAREIPYDEIREIAVYGPEDGLARLEVWLVSGGMIECETLVARWLLEALAGEVPIVEGHELHAGLGL
jgi:hypothetical protein